MRMSSYDADPNAVISRHPALLLHSETLGELIGVALADNAEDTVAQHIAEIAISYLVDKVLGEEDSLLGATEAAPILGLSIERVRQIADEGKMPIPIARVGGKRPIWLKNDVIKAAQKR